MNLKYYLRGLGIGILVTAAIMGLSSGGKNQELGNEEIIKRAKELGMIEANIPLSELNEKEESPQTEAEASPETVQKVTPSPEAIASPDRTPEGASPGAMPLWEEEPGAKATPEAMPEASPEETPKATQEATSEATPEAVQAAGKNEEGSSGEESIVIEVKNGDSSYAVCEKLEAAGLITSASGFDSFLYKGGYDKKIRIGKHEIPAGAEEEAIAEILTNG